MITSTVFISEAQKQKQQSVSETSSVAEIEKQKKAAENEINQTKAELGANEKKVNESLSALRKIDAEIATSQSEMETVKGQLASLQKEISQLEGSISKEEKELEGLRAEYLKAVKKMRVARKKNSDLAFIFASESFNEARRRMRYMREFSEWKDRRSGEILDKVETLKSQKSKLTQARTDASVALKREETVQARLTSQKKEQQTTVNELRANSEALRNKLARRQAESRKLSNQISALIAEQKAKEERQKEEQRRKEEEKRRKAEEKALAEKEAAEKAKKEEERKLAQAQQKSQQAESKSEKKESPKDKPAETASASKGEYAEARKRKPRSESSFNSNNQSAKFTEKSEVTSVATAASKSFGDMKGQLPKPVNGNFKIVSAFGIHPISPELPDIMDENLGIDAHVANGASACAVFDGEVIKVYDRTNTPGFRNIIVVKHGDYITVYANLETLAVRAGQTVRQGQSLGTVGADFDDPSFGLIHFEVWKNQTHLDPAAWIRI